MTGLMTDLDGIDFWFDKVKHLDGLKTVNEEKYFVSLAKVLEILDNTANDDTIKWYEYDALEEAKRQIEALKGGAK